MEKVDRPRQQLLFWITLGVIAFIVLYITGPLRPLKGFFIQVLDPIAGAFSRVVQSGQDDDSQNLEREELQSQIEELTRHAEDLTIENAKLTTRLAELESASAAAQLLEERSLPFLLARTTNVFSFQDASSISIDRGEDDGVRVGQAVVFREGFLVGIVREVHAHAARVRLIFDNDTRLSGTFAGDGSPEGIVVGELGLALHMELIPRDIAVAPGRTVLTAGVEESVPPGLVIGDVITVVDPGSELFKTAQLAPPWDISELTTVAVITL